MRVNAKVHEKKKYRRERRKYTRCFGTSAHQYFSTPLLNTHTHTQKEAIMPSTLKAAKEKIDSAAFTWHMKRKRREKIEK